MLDRMMRAHAEAEPEDKEWATVACECVIPVLAHAPLTPEELFSGMKQTTHTKVMQALAWAENSRLVLYDGGLWLVRGED